MAPAVAREAGLHTGVFDERSGVPAVFGRDLREQQSPADTALDNEPVTTDLDLGNRGDLASRSEY